MPLDDKLDGLPGLPKKQRQSKRRRNAAPADPALAGDITSLADRIRAYARGQQEHWQRIPWLALEADGRSGFSDKYAVAYHHGYWQLDASVQHGHYCVYVDLETGELVNSWEPHEPAFEERVLKLAAHLDELDAGRLVRELEQDANAPYFEHYDVKEHEAWRAKLRKELGLTPVYTRR